MKLCPNQKFVVVARTKGLAVEGLTGVAQRFVEDGDGPAVFEPWVLGDFGPKALAWVRLSDCRDVRGNPFSGVKQSFEGGGA